jgi:hypothetical protein
MMKMRILSIAAVFGFATSVAFAGRHTWDVSEVFSNADGTIQFVELVEANGTPGEIAVGGQLIASASLAHSFAIASNVDSPTSNRHLLFATQSFADLPGAPTPDQIIPAGLIPFFDINGDTVSYGPYDTFVFGAVPTNGIDSMNDGGVVAPNSPTNYAGATGSVDASGGVDCPGDADGDNDVDITDLGLLLANFGQSGAGIPGDVDGDDDVDITDLGILLANFGTGC